MMKKIYLITPILMFVSLILFITLSPKNNLAKSFMLKGKVFWDINENCVLDLNEPGIKGVYITDGVEFTQSDEKGNFQLKTDTTRIIFPILPQGFKINGPFYLRLIKTDSRQSNIIFAMIKDGIKDPESFQFVFMTDIHLYDETCGFHSIENRNAVKGFKKALEHINALKPAFVISGGDLILGALNQNENVSRRQFELYKKMVGELSVPLFNSIGNHDIFGIYRKDLQEHNLSGKGMAF